VRIAKEIRVSLGVWAGSTADVPPRKDLEVCKIIETRAKRFASGVSLGEN